jgi:hypothetical protein
MGGVDKKDQMLQTYLTERERSKKLYLKLFRRLMNVAVHNSYVLYCTKFQALHLTYRLELVKSLLLTYRPQVGRGRPSTNPQPDRLTGRHFIEKIPPTGKKLSPRDDVRFAPSRRTREKRQFTGALTVM